MDIGKLDKLITIQSETSVKNTDSSFDQVFTDLHTNVWCEVKFKRGNDKIEQDRDTSTTFVNFTIRFIDGLTEDMEVVYKSINYRIKNFIETGRDEFLTIEAFKKT